jgi:hypothetical protein
MASEPLAGGLFVVVGLSDDRRAVVLLVVLVVFFVLIVIVVGIARRHRVHEAPLDCRGKKALEGCSWSCRFLPTVGRELQSDLPCSRNAFFSEVAFAGGCTWR